MTYERFQVGNLECFRESDPVFDDYGTAIKYAITLSYNDNPIGVRASQEEGSELLAIVYQQEIFTKD